MANTINYGINNQVIEITDIDSDWSWNDVAAVAAYTNRGGIPIHSILFKPAAGDDQCIITDGDATIFDSTAFDEYSEAIKYFPKGIYTPASMTFTDGAYTAGSKIIFQLYPGEV